LSQQCQSLLLLGALKSYHPRNRSWVASSAFGSISFQLGRVG
jgi:hypothetical protein